MNRAMTLASIGVLLQVLVLVGMTVSAALPLWTGNEVQLKTVPVDPRSLFRGNYARLRYEIAQIDTDRFEKIRTLRHGEVVYVILTQHSDGYWQADDVSLERPSGGQFIRGRLQYPSSGKKSQDVKFGIEAWFAPQEEALDMEKHLRDGGLATVMIDSSGKAALLSVLQSNVPE